MMASEYKKRGGGYTTDKNNQEQSQKNLDKWTEEDWQTKEGSGNAKQEDGTEKRYLPKKAWEQMTEEEKQATDEKKVDESKEGKQHVENTSKAKETRQNATKDNHANGKEKKQEPQDCANHWEDAVRIRDGQEEYEKFKNDEKGKVSNGEENSDSSGGEKSSNSRKRGRGANQSGSSKKQKGGSENEPVGPAGDKTRVPKKGQTVQWKALPGLVDGEVVEIVYEEKTVDGKTVKGSKEDPRIVLKSASSGKIAVHKPEAVYFQ